jgi:hypothetical protein
MAVLEQRLAAEPRFLEQHVGKFLRACAFVDEYLRLGHVPYPRKARWASADVI